MKFNNTKKIPDSLYWFFAITGAIVGFAIMFGVWGIEWYQENELELEYGIFSIFFLIIHLIPFVISVVIGGGAGLLVGCIIATAIDAWISKLCESETDATGNKIFLTKTRKNTLIVFLIFLAIPTIVLTVRVVEKQNIKKEISNYLSTEFALEDIEVKFTTPRDDFYKYGVIVHSSNLDSLEYDKMTRIAYYLTSHTNLESTDVDITSFVCGEDTYKIYSSSVFMNGEKVYEYKPKPSYSITSADAPYYGMDAEFIGSTQLGRPDKTELCRDYHALRPERRSITYEWYDSKGKLIFSAYALNGKVISVTDFRK